MRWIVIGLTFLCGCSTVESVHERPAIFERTTAKGLSAFQGCFAERVARQSVNYLPRENGGSFSGHAGPQEYVFWTVDVDDLGPLRRVRVYAVNSKIGLKVAVPSVLQCL